MINTYYVLKTKILTTIILNFFAMVFAINIFFNILNFSDSIWQYGILFCISVLFIADVLDFLPAQFTINKFLTKLPDLFLILLFFSFANSYRALELYILGRQTLLFIRNIALTEKNKSLIDKLSENPPGFLIFSFIITIFAGTILLLIPSATAQGSTSVLDALFTATSATCVTGLIVQDTGTHFTLFGQIIILLLIQIGGLGIMTISSAFAVMLGQKLTVKSENLMQNVVGESNHVDMVNLVKSIILVTVIIELIGTIIIYLSLSNPIWSVQKAIYYSVFHSISAFCNAGFSLYSNNFIAYMPNLNINFAITTLIILGGIGFPVMVDVQRNLKKKIFIPSFIASYKNSTYDYLIFNHLRHNSFFYLRV